MRKSFALALAVGLAVFGLGYLLGQDHGSAGTASAAAATKNLTLSATPTQAGVMTWRGWKFHVPTPRVFGQVTAISGERVTISAPMNHFMGGTQPTIVQFSLSTKFYAGHTSTASRDAVHKGSWIAVEGASTSNGKVFNAATVMIVPKISISLDRLRRPIRGLARHFLHEFTSPHVIGKVTAVSGNVITVQSIPIPFGPTQSVSSVTITPSTPITAPFSSGNAKISVGEYIAAQGTLTKDGDSLNASRVIVTPLPAFNMPKGPTPPLSSILGNIVRGKVTVIAGKNNDTITIQPQTGLFSDSRASKISTVQLTGDTRFVAQTTGAATKSAVKVGMYIIATGSPNGGGTALTATNVVVLPEGLSTRWMPMGLGHQNPSWPRFPLRPMWGNHLNHSDHWR